MLKNALKRSWQVWRPISRLPVLLLSALFLQSCSTTGTPGTPAKVSAPEQCLQPAPPLPLLSDATLGGAVRNHLEVTSLYWQLAEWHDCLIRFERGR